MTKLKQMRFRWQVTLGCLVLVAVVSVGLGVKAFSGSNNGTVIERADVVNVSAPEVGDETFGAVTGPNHYGEFRQHGPFTYGGNVNATSTTATTYTIVSADLAEYSEIDLMSNTGALTLTMPATSTMLGFLDDYGMTRTWTFHNATSSSGITMTLAAGAGMDLVGVDANVDVIDPGDWLEVKCTRIYYRDADNENIRCKLVELGDAD